MIVKGEVQGVFFRSNAKEKADELNIKGFVKNNSDGSVEIVAKGDKDKLDEFFQWCKHGPSTAKVENFQVDFVGEEKNFDDFSIQH